MISAYSTACAGRRHSAARAAQHFGKADDGVERRAQFVADVGEQPVLPVGIIDCARLPHGDDALGFDKIRHVAHQRDDDRRIALAFEMTRANIDMAERGLGKSAARAADIRATQTQAHDRHAFEARRIRQRLQEHRTIGDLHALEKAAAREIARAQAQNLHAIARR